MIEFFNECVNYVNLPATTLMIMILLYWLMVMIGVFGMDSFDFDLDVNPDIGLDVDVGLDADLGVDADFGVDAHAGGVDAAPATSFGGSSTTGNEGFLRTVFEFFYLGEVPIVIIGTFFVLFFWIATFVTNHFFNLDPQRLLVSLLWLTPNFVISLALTRVTMIPFAMVFKKPPPENIRREEMYGIIGRVTTSEVTEKFGQMEIKQYNEPEMTINVRTRPGKKLGKGDAAKIISYDNSNGTFLVELTKWEKKVDG
jgi:hypothetical protein